MPRMTAQHLQLLAGLLARMQHVAEQLDRDHRDDLATSVEQAREIILAEAKAGAQS